MRIQLIGLCLLAGLLSFFIEAANGYTTGHSPQTPDASAPMNLSVETARKAIDIFETALNERWSYRYVNNANFRQAIAALRTRINRGISQDDLGVELQKILALGIDGHSRVLGYRFPAGRYLPFLIEPSGNDRFVAFTGDRQRFLADRYPFITKIDGRKTAEWCAAAATLIPKGSPQYIRHRCVNLLREIDYWRTQLKVARKQTVTVELADESGSRRKSVDLPLADSPMTYGVWPAGGSRILESNVGYVRLRTMQAEPALDELKRWMPRFHDTAGLIVDVRDNDGGDRDALLWLYSYLAHPDDPPRIINVAAYRLQPERKDDYLAENHRMYRAQATEWRPAERQAIADFVSSFKPEWKLPEGQFSEWHYLVLTRSKDPNVYYYDRPVVVLLNGRSFSATDIFLAGLKGMRNVTLVGTASSGGSAFSQEVVLGDTKLRLRIGSMASFQADGKLFDGHGIPPDLLVEPVPDYFIGRRDNALESALKLIEAKASRP